MPPFIIFSTILQLIQEIFDEMISIRRITFWGLLVLNTVLAVVVINLGAFK
jgi:hypothetical protein